MAESYACVISFIVGLWLPPSPLTSALARVGIKRGLQPAPFLSFTSFTIYKSHNMSKDNIKARKVTDDIWIFSRLFLFFRLLSSLTSLKISRPFTRFGILPLGGRSVAVKLSNGGVWVLASTPPTEETKAAIDGLGLAWFSLLL